LKSAIWFWIKFVKFANAFLQLCFEIGIVLHLEQIFIPFTNDDLPPGLFDTGSGEEVKNVKSLRTDMGMDNAIRIMAAFSAADQQCKQTLSYF
jgi:hypothetical protein